MAIQDVDAKLAAADQRVVQAGAAIDAEQQRRRRHRHRGHRCYGDAVTAVVMRGGNDADGAGEPPHGLAEIAADVVHQSAPLGFVIDRFPDNTCKRNSCKRNFWRF